MNFKSVTINLLLTTLSGGVLLQTLEAQAASITFDPWEPFNKPQVTTSSRFATGGGNASPMTLKAFAKANATDDESSWGQETATTIISLSNFFTVTPGEGEKNGDQVKGVLSGKLKGFLSYSGQDTDEKNFEVGVKATVNVGGFKPWDEQELKVDVGVTPGVTPDPDLLPALIIDTVDVPVEGEGILTIGERYRFEMKLEVLAKKRGHYFALSNFSDDDQNFTPNRDDDQDFTPNRDDDQGFTANVRAEPIPEPLTIFGSATGLGFAAFFKRKHSKKQKKC